MKKWIKFKFKNNLWIYLAVIWVLLGLFSVVFIIDGELWLAILNFCIAIIATLGSWFGTHYGLKITDDYYILISNAKIERFEKNKVNKIRFLFAKLSDGRYSVHATAYSKDREPVELIWTDVHAVKGGELSLALDDDAVKRIQEELIKDEKIEVKTI